MKSIHFQIVIALAILIAITAAVGSWVKAAGNRLTAEMSSGKSDSEVAIASASDEAYCTPELKQILRRVLTSCGLVKDGQAGRGCQPMEAKSVASMSGGDFNALFKPLANRAAIIQFDQGKSDLDPGAIQLLEKTFSDQRGASYFFVVSRASPEGAVEKNRELSEARAGSVLSYLKTRFTDPDLEQEVGLLWLGEEFAQLEKEYCQWNRSRPDSPCSGNELNRSAFIAWIDCKL
jgi:outer membrane protein OmpA-like peptidoglycan-associated protein